MSGIESYEAARAVLDRQLATDYCLPEGAIGLARQFGSNLLTAERLPLEKMRSDRRRSIDHWELRLAHYSGITLLSAQHSRALQAIEEQLAGDAGAWVGDYSKLLRVNDYLSPSAIQNTGTALFFTPGRDLFKDDRQAEHQDAATQLSQEGVSFRWLEPAEFDAYRGHELFTNAFGFSQLRPDLYVLAAHAKGQPVAAAGASADSSLAYQIGVDTLPDYRNRGLASYLVHKVALKVLEQGKLPFYGTSPSHILSQKVAVKAGLEPTWWEFASTSLLDIDLERPEHNLVEGNLPS